MELKLALIRHGQTENSEHRLIGTTDVPLSEEGRFEIHRKLESKAYPHADVVYSSVLARCMETARIIYPNGIVVVENDLRAPNYGDFDGKSYDDLAGDEDFADWGSSASLRSTPNGEDFYMVSARSAASFRRICANMASNGFGMVSIVSHWIVLRTILQRYCVPRISYSSWELLPGEGYLISCDALNYIVKIEHKF